MDVKKIVVLMICVMTVFLAACGQKVEPVADPTTESTFPTLDENRTPVELLQEAADATRSLGDFTVEYVRITLQERVGLSATVQSGDNGTYTAETRFGTLSAEGKMETPVWRSYQGNTCKEQGPEGGQILQNASPYTLPQILEGVTEFNGRTGLIRQFSNYPMNVIPSYDGSFLYQLENLTQDELSTLLYGNINADLPEGSYTAAITVAPNGYLSSLEFTGTDFQVCLTITSNDRGTEPSI